MDDDQPHGLPEWFAGSVWALWLKPVVDYIIRFAELIVLTAAFKIAATKTESLFIEIFVVILTLSCGFYSGVAFGMANFWIEKFRMRRTSSIFIFLATVSVVMCFAAFELSRQIAIAIEQFTVANADE